MRKMGQERQASQQPAERNFTSRATNFISHTTTPPYNGLGGHGRSAQPHHPSMMSILNHPAQTIHRNASAPSSSMPRTLNAPQATNQFAVATTSSSSGRQYLPHHSQGEGQYSMSSPNHSYPFSPYEYQNTAPNVTGNMLQPQRMYPYHPPPNHNIQHDVTALQNAYALPNNFRIYLPYDNTQTRNTFSPSGVPAVGSDFSSFYPQVEYQNGHAFHDESCQDSNILYPLPAPGLRSQPNLPNYHSQFPAQVHQDQPHGDGPYQSSLHDPSTPTREEHSFSCGWVDGKNGPCGFKGSRDAFKAHFLNVHLTGPQDGQIVCLWKGCSYIKRGKPEVHTMRRDSAWRHTREIHLGDKYRRVQAI